MLIALVFGTLVALVLAAYITETVLKRRCEQHGQHGPWTSVYGGRACQVCGYVETFD